MLPPRRLWTGPPAAAIREHLLAELGSGPAGLWIVPTPLARDQLVRLMGFQRSQSPGGAGHRVLCWGDLWRVVRTRVEDGPSWLSEPACRALFREAIDRAREAGEVEAIEASIRWPGYRRRLRARVDEWTISERPARGHPARGDEDPVAAAEWAV